MPELQPVQTVEPQVLEALEQVGYAPATIKEYDATYRV